MKDINTKELNDKELEQVSGGAPVGRVGRVELVNVEIYCKDCGNVISSWQEIKGTSSMGYMQGSFCNNCNSQNIGEREISIQS